MSLKAPTKTLDIKISTVVAVLAILHDADPAALGAALREITGGQSEYFDNELAVLDVGALDPAVAPDWAALLPLFRACQLIPVAVRNAPAAQHAQIQAQGLAIDVVARPRAESSAAVANALKLAAETVPVPPDMSAASAASSASTSELVASAPAAPAAPSPAPINAPAMIVDTPVRSGQRIYARGCDLILTAAVNHGAEVIADGSIHVYAPLRGRALAGASGDTSARIFSTSMTPELLSIAGMYRTFEAGLAKELAGKPVQVKLVGDRLDIVGMKLD